MGKRYEQRSDMCGCERCAKQAETGSARPVFDVVEDPNVLDCGCSAWRGCECAFWDLLDDYDPEDQQ